MNLTCHSLEQEKFLETFVEQPPIVSSSPDTKSNL